MSVCLPGFFRRLNIHDNIWMEEEDRKITQSSTQLSSTVQIVLMMMDRIYYGLP